MRKLIYVLANGTTVNTWTEAVMSGMPFSAEMEEIPEPRPARTKAQEDMIKRFGYISPKLRNA